MTPRDERFEAWRARPGRPTLVALLEASQGRIFAICRDVLKDRHEAEEAAQESLLKIVYRIDQVRDSEHFEHWSGQVAYRTALNRQRSLRLRRMREVQSVRRGRNCSAPWDAVHQAIEELPVEDRALIVERYFERRTLDDMGRRRGISDVGVRKRIDKAHGRLRKSLLAGVLAMNVKAFAVGAVLLLAVLSGIKVASRRTSSAAATAATPMSPMSTVPIGAKPAGDRIAVDSPKPEEVDRRRWTLQNLQEYAKAWRRYQELSRAEPERARAEDSQVDMARLYQLLREQSQTESGMFDPFACIDFFKTPEGAELKRNLIFLLAPAVESEMETEDSEPGPLLSGLLGVTLGSRADKSGFLYFAQHISKSNRTIADIAFRAFAEEESLQDDAMAVLAVQASRGNLKESIRARSDLLLRIAMFGPEKGSRRFFEPGDAERLTRGAWAALMVVDRPEVDEFLVRRMEACPSAREALGQAEHLSLGAHRLLGVHTERFAAKIRAAAELPFTEAPHFHVLLVSAYLPPQTGIECLSTTRPVFRHQKSRLAKGSARSSE
jgi:RNA polymerase sigma factor (sigma-70 family)